MPRTRSLAWAELKIGLLTIVALVITALLIFSLTGTRGFFWQRYYLKTRLPNAAGLVPGGVHGPQFPGGQVHGADEALEPHRVLAHPGPLGLADLAGELGPRQSDQGVLGGFPHSGPCGPETRGTVAAVTDRCPPWFDA